jgi:hypothetical protein
MFLEIRSCQILGVQVTNVQLAWRPNGLDDILFLQLSQEILSRFYVASPPSHTVVVYLQYYVITNKLSSQPYHDGDGKA